MLVDVLGADAVDLAGLQDATMLLGADVLVAVQEGSTLQGGPADVLAEQSENPNSNPICTPCTCYCAPNILPFDNCIYCPN